MENIFNRSRPVFNTLRDQKQSLADARRIQVHGVSNETYTPQNQSAVALISSKIKAGIYGRDHTLNHQYPFEIGGEG